MFTQLTNRLAIFFAISGVICGSAVAAAEQPSWRMLFNGKDLSGWAGEGYAVENETIVCLPGGKDLVSEERFANYTLEFEFMLAEGASSGIGLNFSEAGAPADHGMRLQLLDNSAAKHKTLSSSQRNSSLFQLAPAKPAQVRPTGEWNHQRVTVTATGLMVMLNDEVVLRANLDEIRARNPRHVGVNRRSGHLVIHGNGTRVAFKNLRILELAPLANATAAKAAGFRSLSPSKDLSGWKKGEASGWSSSNGIIKHRGGDAILWTDAEMADFTLVFDWRWTRKGALDKAPLIQADGNELRSVSGSIELEEIERQDAGIILRGHLPATVKLWNWSCGSGGINGYRDLPELRAACTPKLKADQPLGEWNRTLIIVKDGLISVSLNGRSVIETVTLPELPARGPIGLQGGSDIDFANIWIKSN